MAPGAVIAFLLALVLGVIAAEAQSVVRVRDAGPGAPGRILRSVLGAPHEIVLPADSGEVLISDSVPHPRPIVILGADAIVEGTVQGDVVVVDGDLFLHPGAVIEGRAVAIGGGVYNSTLAIARHGRYAWRDATFTTTRVGEVLWLDYREIGYRDTRVVILPGAFGVRIPSYDRVNGFSLPYGPLIVWYPMRIEVNPLLTYRSDLGAVDPSLQVRWMRSRRMRLEGFAGRMTATNESWIRGPILNSFGSLILGTDARNYYRADRGDLRAYRLFESTTMAVTPFLGVRTERAWSVGPRVGARSAPWAVFNRGDTLNGMLRPNPPIDRGRITSGLGGAIFEWEQQRVRIDAEVTGEVAFDAPNAARFQQYVIDAQVGFPTFGSQSYRAESHVLLTTGDTAPRQRWSYLGGSGTLRTLDLLELGGDHLVYIEQEYTIPINRIVIKLMGSPRIGLRHQIGSAGIGGVPEYVQNVGVRLTLGFGRVDWVIDPESKETAFGFGVAFGK